MSEIERKENAAMKCLRKYQWVKLSRAHLPQGKGLMGHWAKLASRAAFRKGQAVYCGYTNEVIPGMWSGGIVGLKSILGLKSRAQVLSVMDELSKLGYITYTLDEKTKKLTYQINDWVIKCSGAECMDGSVYATEGYGFLCLPRSITQRLVDRKLTFGESDAWMDLWCHSVWQDPGNIFSSLAPVVQFGRYGAVLTLETLGQRWNWEKTKVWRFLQKYKDVFTLYRLPGSYGCLIFNRLYPSGAEVSMPSQANVVRIIEKIRILGANKHISGTDHERLNKLVAWLSQKALDAGVEQAESDVCAGCAENRVALSAPIIRAYLSQKNCKNCGYDCKVRVYLSCSGNFKNIRGPCSLSDFVSQEFKAKENRSL
ncbi:MAG: hypothetical protein KH198_08280 [Oscillibacter sp.]|nr:hypothetical protein [Oscillibacter sp.]